MLIHLTLIINEDHRRGEEERGGEWATIITFSYPKGTVVSRHVVRQGGRLFQIVGLSIAL